jgi:uncharacterized protein HemY
LKQARDASALSHDHLSLAATLLHLGDVMIKQGDYTQAETYLQEGLVLARQIDHREHTVRLLQSLGMLAQRRGDYHQAEAHLQAALTLARQSSDSTRVSLLLTNLGVVTGDQKDYAQVENYLRRIGQKGPCHSCRG